MLKLLPLLLALNAAAADKPLVLKTLHSYLLGEYSKPAVDPDFTVLATAAESSVNVWSLETGRQTGRIDLPAVESAAKGNSDWVHVYSVRPDLKLILLSTRHLYPNPKWKEGDKGSSMSRGVLKLYLASLEDGKKPKEIWSFDGPCANWGGFMPFECARLFPNSYIHPDRAEVHARGFRHYSGHLTGVRYEGIFNLAFDLNGKKLFEETIPRRNGVLDRPEKSYAPGSAQPPLSVNSDGQTCDAMRGEKRVSFLEGCSEADSPYIDKNAVLSCANGTFKQWNAETGALITRIETPSPSRDWYALGQDYCSQSADGRTVSVLHKKSGGEVRVEIWNGPSRKLLAVGSGLTGVESFKLSPDGRRALAIKTASAELVDLGLEDAPSAAAAAAPAKLDVDALPSVSEKLDPDAFAIVIGVEKYRQAGVPAVDYASRDAKTMAAYLGAMGFDAKNVAVLTDAQAGKVDFDKHFGKWLKNRVGPKSRVFVYYAGHGAPNPTTGAGYLMPYEADPSYLDETAYPVSQLYAELAKLPTKDVTVVLDACFSGQGERSLIAKGTRPLVAMQKTRGPENAAVIAAASGSQISASDHEARHGLLTYHLLAGLHGGADDNGDGKITTAELFKYAGPAVERAAKLQNVEQTPTVSGENGLAGERVWTTLKNP